MNQNEIIKALADQEASSKKWIATGEVDIEESLKITGRFFEALSEIKKGE